MITAPVTIANVKTALGETSNDLGTLCRHMGINVWSRFKPINHSGKTLDVSPIQENGSYRAKQLTDYIKLGCGMTVPICDQQTLIEDAGTTYNTMFETVNEIFKNNGQFFGAPVYTFFMPQGGTDSPYRLTDFKNYHDTAQSLWQYATNVDNGGSYSVNASGSFVFTATLTLPTAGASYLYQLRPEDLLGCFGDYEDWKLRIEYFTLPDRRKTYVDYDLVDSIANNHYATVSQEISRNPTVPPSLTYLVHVTAYFYNTETKEVVVFPPSVSIRAFALEGGSTARTINIPQVYNGTSWVTPATVSIYTNSLRVRFDIEQNSVQMNIGKNFIDRIRLKCSSPSNSSKYTYVVGNAVSQNGYNVGDWSVPTNTTSGVYTTTYFEFPSFCQFTHSYGDYVNLTFELSTDSGSTWQTIGGFSGTLNFYN